MMTASQALKQKTTMRSDFLGLILLLLLTTGLSSKCVQKINTLQDLFFPKFKSVVPRLETIVCVNITSNLDLDFNYEAKNFRQKLKIKNSFIPKLPANSSLSKFTNITSLEVTNVALKEIEPGAFNGLVRLRELVLTDNKLSKVSPGIFKVPTLEMLSLENNTIKEIDAGSFSNLDQLSFLYLHNNQLRSLPKNLFSNLPSLEELWISGNPLEDFAYSDFPSLKIIVGDKTFLKTLPNLTLAPLNVAEFTKSELEEVDFAKLAPLRFLRLQENRIASISNWKKLDCERIFLDHNELTFFEVPETVLEFHVSHNLITQFPNGQNTKLLELNVAFNNISVVDLNLNWGFPKLEVLNLSYNVIVKVKENSFGGCPRLRKLYLSNNKIEIIEAGAFKALENLDELDISGNNLKVLKSPVLSELKITNVVVGNTEIDWEYVKILIQNSDDLSLQLDNEFWKCELISSTDSRRIKYVTKYNVEKVKCLLNK